MKYYGFNPFISAHYNNEEGIIYHLLEKDIYNCSPNIVEIFSGSKYKSLYEIIDNAQKSGISKNEVIKIINEAKINGIILELNKPFLSKEVVSPIEDNYLSKSFSWFFQRIILQPTGMCAKNCNYCNSYINCCCFKADREWGIEELEVFLEDLYRFKGLIETIEIFGGNPLEYSNIEKLILGLNKIGPKVVNINIPVIAPVSRLVKEVLKLKEICKPFLKITFLIFPAYDDILSLLSELNMPCKLRLFIDNELDKGNNMRIDQIKGKFTILKEYLLKKDLSNINWFGGKYNDNLIKGVDFFDFYYRKHFHRCWSYSFSLDCKGNLRPCLWSDIVLKKWRKGKILEAYIQDYYSTQGFWELNSLENIEGCKNCIYRFGCNDCRVLAEYLSKKKMQKNQLCKK